ncbi:succinyl-diaminopimelate desuccinylase [Hathewaya proteolytica DSM 3090]|uniref:Succinyl-diaminopimelate desuccinylase n=1 Tax=Hathewaya proteolytica DSM 3090 TaxID=1121331 RepID=A0A1M6RTE7_9CLOT|nr:dipeptidase PepV [Hathewaya proteolytica]SHK35781.1 succinyl-diaminopimelate desuccinylase [Hathewaya proteolytica DSM 3090]
MDFNKRIDELKNDLINDTAELVKIKSVEEAPLPGMPFGEGPAKSLQCALNIAIRLGFKTVNLDNYVGYAEFGEGEEYVMALGHVDVVPEGDNWTYPPYGAEIHNDNMYGRGTLDDKGPIMAALYGAKAVMDSKAPISKRIRIVFGSNEETGDSDIEYYLEREKAPAMGFTPDAEYPLINGEKGMFGCNLVKKINGNDQGLILKSIEGGQAHNIVPNKSVAVLTGNTEGVVEAINKYIAEKQLTVSVKVENDEVIVESTGVSVHASTPWGGKNAIMQLFEVLGAVKFGSSDLNQYVEFMNSSIGMNCVGEKFDVGLEDKASGKLSFNIGVISMKENVIDVSVDIRFPVTFNAEDVEIPFKNKLAGTGIEIENLSTAKPLYFEESHPLVQKLRKVYSEQTGKDSTPICIGGGTYAKAMPNILAFGPVFPGDPDTVHQVNEFISIDNLVINAKIYAEALFEMAK